MSHWFGARPTKCDLCRNPIVHLFVDGKTNHGPWAIMCPACQVERGVGLGTGRGQMYRRDGETFKKVEG